MLNREKVYMEKLGYEGLEWNKDDCERISKVALEHGEVITLWEAYDIWFVVSDRVEASFLRLPDDDDDLWQNIREFFI